MKRHALLLALLATAQAHADGGTLRIQEQVGALEITVFSAPEPLRAGAADLSVLVQRASGPVLDANVALVLSGPVPQPVIHVRATREHATNELFYAARVVLPEAGAWTLRARVAAGGDVAEVETKFEVVAARSRLRSHWAVLALPVVAVAVFALRAWLLQRRRRTT